MGSRDATPNAPNRGSWGSALLDNWTLEHATVFLNHGSFGACPKPVLARQAELRARLEAQPVRFFMREAEEFMHEVRQAVSAFVGAAPESVVFVPNATTAVNAVLRSLPLERGARLLATDHTYNACKNALDFVAKRAGADVDVVTLPFPLSDPAEVVDAIVSGAGKDTRLALIDHVTSPTGMVLPIADIVRELQARDVVVLVDGAHAPGMVELNLASLGADFYTGNLHKWVCAPKGAAFLSVGQAWRDVVRPTTISHGANARHPNYERLALEFDWQGTDDPTALFAVPAALQVMEDMVPGGWPEIRRRNRALALEGRELVAAALDVQAPIPASMIGSLAALPLPGGVPERPPTHTWIDPVQDALFYEHHIEVPVFPWAAIDRKLVRFSAQLYNALSDYEALARALRRVLRP